MQNTRKSTQLYIPPRPTATPLTRYQAAWLEARPERRFPWLLVVLVVMAVAVVYWPTPATVRTLQYLGNGYEGIVAGIRANDAEGMLVAVAGSRWCWQCYGGSNGLNRLYEQVKNEQ